MEEIKAKIEAGWNLKNSYAELPEIFFTKQSAEFVPLPKLIILNYPLAEALGLNAQILKSNYGTEVFAGNKIPEGALPLAEAYAGHQYGHFTMLGDGRALLLGEQITQSGGWYDIQLKGSGLTPYSRRGDGKAALGPMLREYIISEAMNSLGIPTTRSLAVVTTGEEVIREKLLQGAVLTRVAASHIRVGTFQYAARWGNIEELRALADYTIKRHFLYAEGVENRYIFLLKEVIKRQALLIAKWQLIGFIHGVMNTDNMAISGETIDYGPCAFMDKYDPATVFSSIDNEGRYAYGNQPYIAVWNLSRFAETLIPLIDKNQNKAIQMAEDALSEFTELYHNNWIAGMRGKLGMFNKEEDDEFLIKELLNIMYKYGADYTNTFRGLTLKKLSYMDLFQTESFSKWYKLWQERLGRQQESKESSTQLMKNSNPSIIPRNHKVEEAIEAAYKGDYSVMKRFLDVLLNPYEYSSKQDDYSALPKESDSTYRTFCGT